MSSVHTKTSLASLLLIFIILNISLLKAQAPQPYSASDIELALKKLNVLGSALYIAAHPDDENTRLIGWLSNEKLANTGYLSMTRGDGGQNLIGPEIREELGVIRTHELLQARKLDGSKQFFTRANDFGYSKHPDETFTIWDKEKVLADVVWVIRKFRPEVLITRFNIDPGKTHGHHTASAILASEAFEAAGDSTKFPDQLDYVDVWQPKKLLWNTSPWFYKDKEDFDTTGLVKVDVGAYNPLLGQSYTEIAAKSRSMHKSQGFGASGSRGSTIEYLKPEKGDTTGIAIFEGINTSWSRVEGGEKVGDILAEAYKAFDPEKPAAIVPLLLEAVEVLQTLPDGYWKEVKADELKRVIKASMGLFLEVSATDFSAAPGDSVTLNIEAVNRSGVPAKLKSVSYAFTGSDTIIDIDLDYNRKLSYTTHQVLPTDIKNSQPYWLREKGSLGMYHVENQEMIGMPENQPALNVKFNLTIQGREFGFEVPIVYKRTDPVEGEQYRPFEITPPVFVNIKERVYVFANGQPKKVELMVKSGEKNVGGTLALHLPEGWKSEPASLPVDLKMKGEEANFSFQIFPPEKQSVGNLKAVVKMDGKTYGKSLVTISYDHIPTQTIFPEATARVVKLDIEKKGELIGYVMGAGDGIPSSLAQIGYKVEILDDTDFNAAKLKRYDAIILGIRAYNTIDRLKFHHQELMDYVENGGTLIVQYNTNFRLVTDEIAPYPLKISRDRVTVEEAPVRLLQPDHPVLNTPNKITQKDFEDWVQERGLYFPDEWDKEYDAILSSNDPGEDPKDGGLLIARYGKGYYIYTGYSWFRELPAGVPGAYRLFTNMISIGKRESSP